MTWFRVDDTLAGNLKAREAGNRAMGLWVMSGSFASEQLTDGFVPEWFVRGFHYGPHDAGVLVSVGLWDRVEGGFVFHDWTDRNPTRVQVETQRESTRERVASWRKSRGTGNGVTNAVSNAARTHAPTRPDPIKDIGDIVAARPARDDELNRSGIDAARAALPRGAPHE